MKELHAIKLFFGLLLAMVFVLPASGQETETLYLSGTENDHTVNWDFYCSAGRNAGKWTSIPVPSNWEFQGFGKYDYGFVKDSVRGKETGQYKHRFSVPLSWKGKKVNIVFEGSMTDTKVTINGTPAGPVHQGAFYRFKYDVSALLHYGAENLLEVTVAKHSANESVNKAERRGDFWIFGGIFRPVLLEALPTQHIERLALDAGADGHFTTNIFLDRPGAGVVSGQIYMPDGHKVGAPFETGIHPGDTVVRLHTIVSAPKLWSPEFPNLYYVIYTLQQSGKVTHILKQRFGFRTVELRERDGFYVNGVKVKFKGVNHHSFWPTSGRTTSKTLSIEDVQLMKDMNMNAVRMSHYPPDEHLIDVCDSLGLFVMDELCGWHQHYDDVVGTKLAEETVLRDLNHPSVVMWSNGNEGGFNFALDPVFDRLDALQHRPLIHPWAIFRGTDTQHYINFDYGNGSHLHGHNVVFPTEFLHGLYDGGHGAGLEDYWEQMWHYPLSAGGFLWVFADEGAARADKDGIIDVDIDHGLDGIVGPFHEKEASYYTIKEVWSPIYIEHREITPAFDGTFRIENRYHFTNISQCSFEWSLMQGAYDGETIQPALKGTAIAPAIAPGAFGRLTLALPKSWRQYQVLYLTARDPHGKEIYTWSWPISRPEQVAASLVELAASGSVHARVMNDLQVVEANGIKMSFTGKGLLQSVENGKGAIPFNNGPILCDSGTTLFDSMAVRQEGKNVTIRCYYAKGSNFHDLTWTVYPSGLLKMEAGYFPSAYETAYTGLSFSYPEADVKSIRWMGNGPYRVWKNRMKGVTLGVYGKDYNNTVTGDPVGKDPLVYPEFKGYYSGFYWMKLTTTGQPFKVLCASEDIFLRLFTPKWPRKIYNTAPAFPAGDISFMHGITPVGTKSQKAENTGPAGRPNMYYDYEKDPSYTKRLVLYFDFSGK